jgi:hypothetical protein
VSTGQKFRLPLSEEQVMDCAPAGRAAIAISAMMPKTIPRNPRIRMRKASRGNPTREPPSVTDFCAPGAWGFVSWSETDDVLIQRQCVFNAPGWRDLRDRERAAVCFRFVEGGSAGNLAGELKVADLAGEAVRGHGGRPGGDLEMKMGHDGVAGIADQPEHTEVLRTRCPRR